MEIRSFGNYECLCMEDRFLFLDRRLADGSISEIPYLLFDGGFQDGGFEYIYNTSLEFVLGDLEIIPPPRADYLQVFEGRGEFYEITKTNNIFIVKAQVPFDSFAWKSSIPIRTFIYELAKELKSVGFVNVFSEEMRDSAESVVNFELVAPENKVLAEACHELRILFEKCVVKVKERKKDFFIEFDVPEEKRYIVSQYLSYFGQFLVDFGIPSNCEVAVHDASLSLSVAPKDKSEAIENIHAALAAYLSLAEDGELVVIPKDDAIATVKYQQLLANMEHLRSQLRLAEALISVKDREISLLEQTLSNSKLIVNGGHQL